MEKETIPPFEQLKCSRCGCLGLHACMGTPVVWTQADKERLKKSLDGFFFKNKNE